MKLKNNLLLGAGVVVASMLASCSSTEDAVDLMANENKAENAETVTYCLEVQVPEEMRTRAIMPDASGLLTPHRPIDKLWYAVYNNGHYMYDSECPGAMAPKLQSGTGPTNPNSSFTVMLNVSKALTPSDVQVFFWAGGADDNVKLMDEAASNVSTPDANYAIQFNLHQGYVHVNPRYMVSDNKQTADVSELAVHDSFCWFGRLDEMAGGSSPLVKSVTLKRPFAEIHILSSEFTVGGVEKAFPAGVYATAGFMWEEYDRYGEYARQSLPNTWHFLDTDEVLLTDPFNTYTFHNGMTKTEPERTTFIDRTMDYLGYLYVFAPAVPSPYSGASSANIGDVMDRFSISFSAQLKEDGELDNPVTTFVTLPAGGLKANNRYVIYNREADWNDPRPGLVSDNYVISVAYDDAWNEPAEKIEF